MTIPRAARIESITPQLRSRSKQTLSLSMRLRSCEDILAQQVRARLRATFSITLPQFDILSELERANAPLTMSQLSERLMVSNGNVTGIVDRLVRDGLVRRIQAETDRRIHLVQLTMRGAEQYASMANVHNLWVTELFTGLSDCE
ncbi:MAG: MarR family transcriptional regulator, partial [Gammaproteobacteria bacterium]|nr:MarR family transcriptional regulator [Gammaproteobacteria bacterium]